MFIVPPSPEERFDAILMAVGTPHNGGVSSWLVAIRPDPWPFELTSHTASALPTGRFCNVRESSVWTGYGWLFRYVLGNRVVELTCRAGDLCRVIGASARI
jgi:hypothetical protein